MAINPDKIKEMEEPWYAPRVDIYDKDNKGPVVQMGVTLTHFTGDLYIKSEHLRYIACEHLGMVTQEAHDKALRELREANEKTVELTAELDRLKEESSEYFNQRLDSLFADYADSRGINGVNPPVANAGDDGDSESVGETSDKTKAKTKDSDDNFF